MQERMTAAATHSYAAYRSAGWTDEQLVAHGLLQAETETEATLAADKELLLLIERVERLNEEKAGIAEDIKDVFAEAKARGYDVKGMREIIKIRKKRRDDYEHEKAIIETYGAALGMDL